MKEKEIERLTKLKEIEKDLYGKGFKNICGIDEAAKNVEAISTPPVHTLLSYPKTI